MQSVAYPCVLETAGASNPQAGSRESQGSLGTASGYRQPRASGSVGTHRNRFRKPSGLLGTRIVESLDSRIVRNMFTHAARNDRAMTRTEGTSAFVRDF